MSWSVRPDPSDQTERQALLAAVEQALAEERGEPTYAGAWWRAGFEELGGFDETLAVSPGCAARPDAASSVAPVSD